MIVSTAAKTSSSLGRSIELLIDKLSLLTLKFSKVHSGLLLVRTDKPEQHMPVSLFELISWMKHVKAKIILASSVFLNIVKLDLNIQWNIFHEIDLMNDEILIDYMVDELIFFIFEVQNNLIIPQIIGYWVQHDYKLKIILR